MLAKKDTYAKGMVASGEEHFDLTPELDLFQYRMIKPHLGKSILEVGAGPGRIARLLLQDDLAYEQYVISEPSDHFFEQLKKRVAVPSAKITLVQGETSDLVKQYPRAFDAIFSVHVLEHVEDDRRFLQDCLEMLKPGGKLIILVPALQILYSDLDRQIGHYRRYDKSMVRRLIQGLDCSMQSIYYTNFLAIFASLIAFKLLKIDYQKNDSHRRRFVFLEKVYSRYFIPMIDLMERHVPMPVGLNLTFVLRLQVENNAASTRPYERARAVSEYVRFVGFGILNTSLCFVIYFTGVLLGLNYALANSIAWIVGVLMAFFLNSTFVFRKRYEHRRLLSFVCWNVLSLILSTAVLSLLIKVFDVDSIVAAIIAIPVVVTVNYLAAKFFVFS